MDSYRYPNPFSMHLLDFFKRNKQMGSKDRKELRQYAYSWFRTGRLFKNAPLEQQLLKGREITDAAARSEWDIVRSVFRENNIKSEELFPLNTHLPDELKTEDFYLSHLLQPYVWIKIKLGAEFQVMEELRAQELAFISEDAHTAALPPECRLDTLHGWQKGQFRVQDLSSQKTAAAFNPAEGETWWDACAGGGGKSLALLDKGLNLKLYVSDIRKQPLENLTERIRLAGYRQPQMNLIDLEKPVEIKLPKFDGIIIDAPCSGSGTWARNPENLHFFNPESIGAYHQKQVSIVKNALPFLKPGKPLIYITCSVFKDENEAVINELATNHGVTVEELQVLKGYDKRAENMFLCRLLKTGE
jgi:16S rRNA (cytosine967-C5)-methyltransferase